MFLHVAELTECIIHACFSYDTSLYGGSFLDPCIHGSEHSQKGHHVENPLCDPKEAPERATNQSTPTTFWICRQVYCLRVYIAKSREFLEILSRQPWYKREPLITDSQRSRARPRLSVRPPVHTDAMRHGVLPLAMKAGACAMPGPRLGFPKIRAYNQDFGLLCWGPPNFGKLLADENDPRVICTHCIQ